MTRLLSFSLAAATSLALACASPIQHGLDERDANELVSVLTTRGFDARKSLEKGKKPTWAIEVEGDRATDALRVMAELKLPRAQKLTTAKIAGEPALIETPLIERLRQLEGQEGDLEQSLETLDGVTSAAVELVVPPPPRPGAAAVPSKASVLLRVSGESLERVQHQRAELRALVAASVDGLLADDVVLVIDEVQGHAAYSALTTASSNRALRGAFGGLALGLSALAIGLVGAASRLANQRKGGQLAAAVPQSSLRRMA